MSTTISTSAMVTALQLRYSIGIQSAQWMGYINEAFRKINQFSQGGFVWQLKRTTVSIPIGAQVPVALPSDFDPGKSAFLYGSSTGAQVTMTDTEIPYMAPSEFVKEQHFSTTDIGMFSSWTFYPNFSFGPPTVYGWTLRLAPDTAFPLTGNCPLGFYYHAVNFPAFASGPTTYFPTPDQFDSAIMDIAESEARRIYGAAGWDKLASLATQAVAAVIDTYRTDRFSLAGLTDVMAQAQEKAVEGDK